MKITVETDNGKIHAYEGAKAVFLTVDIGDSYENLVDGAVSPGFVKAVTHTTEALTQDFLRRLIKEIPEENLKELLDMLEIVEQEDADEDADEDG